MTLQTHAKQAVSPQPAYIHNHLNHKDFVIHCTNSLVYVLCWAYQHLQWSADEVEVTGIVTRQWLYSVPGTRCSTNLLLSANHLYEQNRQQLSTALDLQAVDEFCKFWQDHSGKHMPSVAWHVHGEIGVDAHVGWG